jgi:hypothetical protein
MFGQIRIEFVFGIIIFAIIITIIITQNNILFSSLLTDSKSDTLKAKASNAIKILVEDKGEPSEWQIGLDSEVKRVGLAYDPYNLSLAKITRLNTLNNCTLLNNFDLKAYRLKVYNSTHQILFCGFDSLEPPTAIETRYVFINNEFGKVTLEMW